MSGLLFWIAGWMFTMALIEDENAPPAHFVAHWLKFTVMFLVWPGILGSEVSQIIKKDK